MASFDGLLAAVTVYRDLDESIEKTRMKSVSLLMLLDHPGISLHNNPAELGARRRVHRHDVSFGLRTPGGAKTSDGDPRRLRSNDRSTLS